jgi:hypothetical protein
MATRKFLRRILGPDRFHLMERAGFISATGKPRRRPPPDDFVGAVPPSDPLPMTGGAAAPIEDGGQPAR